MIFTEKRQKRKTQDNHNKYILIFGIASRSNPTKVSPSEMRQQKRYECATQQRLTVDDDETHESELKMWNTSCSGMA